MSRRAALIGALVVVALAAAGSALSSTQPGVRVNYALSYCYLAPVNPGVDEGQLHVYVWLRNRAAAPQHLPFALQLYWRTAGAQGWHRYPGALGARAIGVIPGRGGARNLPVSRPATQLLACGLKPAVKGATVHPIRTYTPAVAWTGTTPP